MRRLPFAVPVVTEEGCRGAFGVVVLIGELRVAKEAEKSGPGRGASETAGQGPRPDNRRDTMQRNSRAPEWVLSPVARPGKETGDDVVLNLGI